MRCVNGSPPDASHQKKRTAREGVTMASVFKRNGKNGRKSPCWTIQYLDAHGKNRQKKGRRKG